MAGGTEERTEKPTPKRLKEARREGRVARSPEVSGWAALLVAAVVLPSLGGRAVRSVTGLITSCTTAMSSGDPHQAVAMLSHGLRTFLSAVLPLVAVTTATALIATFAQVGLRWAPGSVGVKFSRVSPSAGLRRLLSPNGMWDLGKLLLRLALLAGVGYLSYRHMVTELLDPGTLPLTTTVHLTVSSMFTLLRTIAFAALVVALADYAWQRRRFNESVKMTREQVRREMRETEANPETRKAQRRRRRTLSRNQLLAATATADVIVVNPTHFSVGLAYDRDRDRAPRVVTKGEDDDAVAIRSEARRLGVPVVANPPVARSLYDGCEIGTEIPAELFATVARLLAFVYRLSPASRSLVDVHRMPGG